MSFSSILNNCRLSAPPTCNVCFKSFSAKQSLLRHLREQHEGALPRKPPTPHVIPFTSPSGTLPTAATSPQPDPAAVTQPQPKATPSPVPTAAPSSPQPGTSSSPQPGPSDCSGKKGNCTLDSLRLYIAIVKIYIIRLFACF